MNKRRRTRIGSEAQTRLLITSGRRCCLCFGLQRKDDVVMGQIAHLDGNPKNNKFENLAWVCLLHHAEYDTRTRQHKGLTANEVKEYRGKLYEYIGAQALRKEVAETGKWSQLTADSPVSGIVFSGIDIELRSNIGVEIARMMGSLKNGNTDEMGLSIVVNEDWERENYVTGTEKLSVVPVSFEPQSQAFLDLSLIPLEGELIVKGEVIHPKREWIDKEDVLISYRTDVEKLSSIALYSLPHGDSLDGFAQSSCLSIAFWPKGVPEPFDERPGLTG